MFQSWKWLTFLHWRYHSDEIRRLLPQQLALDTFDGSARGLDSVLAEGASSAVRASTAVDFTFS
ncbi:MAG: DUF2071 domain-containing protein [Bryobacteraceae bacterium]